MYIILLRVKSILFSTLIGRRRCRSSRIGYVVDVREFRLESLEAAVAAVVHHDGDDHGAKERHNQHARQRPFVSAAWSQKIEIVDNIMNTAGHIWSLTAGFRRRGQRRRRVVRPPPVDARATCGYRGARRHVAVVALEAGPAEQNGNRIPVI